MAGRPRLRVAVLPAAALAAAFAVHGPGPAAGAAGQSSAPPPALEPSSGCLACHNGLVTSAGEDVSIGSAWRASMMANAARDPYWQAAVRREVLDHPAAQAAIEDECAKCHMPAARLAAHAAGRTGAIFAHLPAGASAAPEAVLAADGVSCTVCHRMRADRFGTRDSFTGGFVIEPASGAAPFAVFGPFAIDPGLASVMRSATGHEPVQADHVQQSEMCATCHSLYTHAPGADGQTIGELPEQVPYLEWRHSAYRTERSCQSCHMPVVETPTPIASVLGEPRDGFSRHDFRGGNFLVLRMLLRDRLALGVQAPAAELGAAADRAVAHLQESATLAIEAVEPSADRLRFVVDIRSAAGHKLPTAYPSRRVWLHVIVRDAGGRALFESGALLPDGRIAGNDNDEDPRRVEPHYAGVTSADQVQIYESVMADAAGAPTTALLKGVRYLKDNRLLPRGFDKTTAEPDIAVHGGAASDADFGAGGDRTHYAIDLASARAASIEAELWYQPIGFRWARNFDAYEAPEIDRFRRAWTAMAPASAVRIARVVKTTGTQN